LGTCTGGTGSDGTVTVGTVTVGIVTGGRGRSGTGTLGSAGGAGLDGGSESVSRVLLGEEGELLGVVVA